MSGKPAKEWVVRDPIHGFVEPTQQEIDLIDTPVFQRLRGIKQLANTHLVFPGATHTRFEHSYGTMHMAWRMARRVPSLPASSDRMRILRLTGLLHDIGHGPFSHVSEDIVSRVLKQDKFDNVSIALDAITLNDGLRSNLGKDTDAVLDLLGNKERASIDHDIIDSDLDADKLDYLLRDSYYTGVPYGHPDTLRILYTLKEIPAHEGSEFSLGISMKGIEAAEGLKIARYHMHSAVYNHKVRRVADAMLDPGRQAGFLALRIQEGRRRLPRSIFCAG